jgi:hypothetical protein
MGKSPTSTAKVVGDICIQGACTPTVLLIMRKGRHISTFSKESFSIWRQPSERKTNQFICI